MAANGDEGRAVSVAGLNALLGMVERPLVAIGGGRRILGANRAFEEFVIDRGLLPSDPLPAIFERGSCEALDDVLRTAGGTTAPNLTSIRLVGGESVAARAEVIGFGEGARVALVVLDPPRQAAPRGDGPSSVASLRHDVAAPLTAIMGDVELLLLRGEGRCPEDLMTIARRIFDHCARMNEILARSRAEELGR